MSIRLFNPSGGFIDLNAGGDGTAANVFTLPAETGTLLTNSGTLNINSSAPDNSLAIDSSGNVGIGTTSPGAKLQVTTGGSNSPGSNLSGNLGQFTSSGGIAYVTMGNGDSANQHRYVGAASAIQVFGKVTDAGTTAEHMRIDATGAVLIGTTTNGTTVPGVVIRQDGETLISRENDNPLLVNRLGNDGDLVQFRQANSQEGSISVSGSTVSYNQFMGSHWSTLSDWSRPDIKIGTILDSINELVIYKYAIINVDGEQKKICYNGNESANATVSVEYEGETYEGTVQLERDREFTKGVKVKINDTAASKAVYGVFVGWNNDKDGDGGIWNDMYVGAVGNYVVRMAEGQEPQIGDLIEADGNGCGVIQDDDIIRSKTVGKITNNIPQVTYEDGSFLVTCVLYCG
jgi:hypothetical protein